MTSLHIQNDYISLDKHFQQLEQCRTELKRTRLQMHESIINLNEKGFQDGNFENLYDVFTHNLENIQRVEIKIQKFQEHIAGLSNLIKKYYNIQL
jgi:hypothetical protein